MARKITRKELEQARREIDEHGTIRIYGYKHAFCSLNDCCENCDKHIRFWCKVMHKIEDIQTGRILKICNKD